MITELGVVYTYKELKEVSGEVFLKSLQTFTELKGYSFEQSQTRSWEDCYQFLIRHFQLFDIDEKLCFIFEYLLPFEGGRRPDVILLIDEKVMILEFKRKGRILLKDQEQAIHYREDIQNYHAFTNQKEMAVESCLVYTSPILQLSGMLLPVLTENSFGEYIEKNIQGKKIFPLDKLQEWLFSKYEPLQNIIQASKKLFETGELPAIKRIQKGDIKGSIDLIYRVVKSDKTKKTIIFFNGVPGSGKTLVGLKTVHQYLDSGIQPIYISGNGPLVNVLQGLLSEISREGRAFVRDMYAFKAEYSSLNKASNNQYIVFDEAQRAWDEEKMKGDSEAHVLLDIADKIAEVNGKVIILCLIGEGQSIHEGEEKGLELWRSALENHIDWLVVSSDSFAGIHDKQYISDELFLDTSIRHNFIDVHPMVEAILKADKSEAKTKYNEISERGYRARIIRHKELLLPIVSKLRKKFPDDHTGLFISSKVTTKKMKTIFPKNFKGSFVDKNKAYDWYTRDCYNLELAASEFLCQGLESEWPIVSFGGDYYLCNEKWIIEKNVLRKNRSKYNDFETIMQNTYRVLLKRSRQGLFLYIPELPELEDTYLFFKEMGIDEINGKNEND